MGRRLGLLIGVNSFQDAAFSPLQFAENDTRALGQWLVNVQGGNWAPADVQLLIGAQASRELAESLILQVCLHIAEPDDIVLIYFAGHGFVDERSGEGYLAFANTYYAQPATGLHVPSLLRQALGSSRAASIVFLLDCFQTGVAWSRQRTSAYDVRPLAGLHLLNILQQVPNRILFCSCRGNERAPEVGDRNIGRLVHRMILGLAGQARNPVTGQVTLHSLSTFLSSVLDEQHRPQLFGQEQYPFVFVGETASPSASQQNRGSGVDYSSEMATGVSSVSREFQNASGPLMEQVAHAQLATAYVSPASSGPLSFQASSPTSNEFVAQLPFPGTDQLPFPGQASPELSPVSSGQFAVQEETQQRLQQGMMLLSQARQLVQMQRFAEALQAVEQVLEILPTQIDALILKCQILGATGRYPESLVIVERILQLNSFSALGWSMRAALLTNLGQYQEALTAVERSIALDPSNTETLSVKEAIQTQLAQLEQLRLSRQYSLSAAPPKKPDGPLSFFIGLSLQVFALIIGVIGASLPMISATRVPVMLPQVPIYVVFGLESLGLAILCVNAARGSYLYGFMRVLLTLFVSVVTAGILGAIYRFGYTRLLDSVKLNPPLLIPILFLGVWLVAAATVPLVLALGGFIAWIVRKVIQRRS